MNPRGAKRYRCHTGHSFTATSLLTAQLDKIEESCGFDADICRAEEPL
ncbi:MAG: hypothetical protein ABIU05_17360 [Nitrospirales bacterium]